MNDIFDNGYDDSSDGLTPAAPTEPKRKLSMQNHKDLAELWQQAQRKGLESAYHSDHTVKAFIDAEYGNRPPVPSEAAMVAATSKSKPVDLMRALKRDLHNKYGIKE